MSVEIDNYIIARRFKGYLIKVAGVEMPPHFIAAESYVVSPNQRQDTDPFVDAYGVLDRTVLPHKRTKISFSTQDELSLIEKIELQKFFAAGTIDVVERKVTVEYWDDENNEYKTGTFYQPDYEYSVISYSYDDIRYSPIKVILIEY